jgi:restriction endonuclease S subunit
VQYDIKDMCRKNECDEFELKQIANINDKSIKRYDTSYGKSKGKYPFYTGATNNELYCDAYNIDKNTIIINKTNGSGKCNIFVDKNISVAKQTYIIQSKDTENITLYIYYFLCGIKNKLQEGYDGACHKNLSSEFLEEFKIKIPKDKKVIESLNPQFQLIDMLRNKVTICEQKYKSLLDELSKAIEKKDVEQTEKTKKVCKKACVKSDTESETESGTESDTESDSDSDEFVWNIKVLSKIKKYKNDKDKLKEIMKENNIPKDIFNEKVKAIKSKE